MTDVEADRRLLRATFDGVAERYDAVRPRYPRALVDDLVALAGLTTGSRVLEVGCGTGQLTVDLAARGLDVTAVELGSNLAAVARRNLAPFPHARVVVAAFEEVPLLDPVDAVVAATSFHWLPPDVRMARSVAALRPGGALAVVDVRKVVGGTEAFFIAMQDCYLRFFPGTEPGFRLPTADEVPPAHPELDASPSFGPVQRRRHTWEVTYTGDRFRALLSTYSNHLDLPADRLDGLLDCIGALIEGRFGGAVTKRYLAELVVAPLRPGPLA
jgi:SAM-dependent methyltransferase